MNRAFSAQAKRRPSSLIQESRNTPDPHSNAPQCIPISNGRALAQASTRIFRRKPCSRPCLPRSCPLRHSASCSLEQYKDSVLQAAPSSYNRNPLQRASSIPVSSLQESCVSGGTYLFLPYRPPYFLPKQAGIMLSVIRCITQQNRKYKKQ